MRRISDDRSYVSACRASNCVQSAIRELRSRLSRDLGGEGVGGDAGWRLLNAELYANVNHSRGTRWDGNALT
jgi:hypothetical protein